MDHAIALRSMRLLMVESVITRVVIAMPIVTIFLSGQAGLSLFEVTIAQAAFSATMIALDIVTGWLADVFSRRLANMIGDTVVAGGFVYYAFVDSFHEVLIAEVIVGIGLATSSGADGAMLASYAKVTGRALEKLEPIINLCSYGATAIGVAIGGWIGAHNPPLAIGLSSVVFVVGALLSHQLVDDGQRRVVRHAPGDSPWRRVQRSVSDIKLICREAIAHRQLAWSMAAHAVGREITHPVVWLLTPLLLTNGVSDSWLGAGWFWKEFTAGIGAALAIYFVLRMSGRSRFVIGTGLALTAYAVLLFDIGWLAIVVYGLLGVAQGWSGSTLRPIVLQHAPADVRATVMSVTGTFGRIIYIPVVVLCGWLGDTSPQLAIGAMLALFLPATLLIVRGMRDQE